MATNIGAKVELAGEREFRNALTAINAGLKVTASELALVTAQYSNNAGSVTALTERGNVLQNQISGQREKIEKLREALQNAAVQYGESDKRTMQWQTSLNKAQTELIKMESELENNSKELDQAKKSMDKYGLSVDDVAESHSTLGEKLSGVIEGLGINLPPAADNAIKALDGAKLSTAAFVGITAGLIGSLANLTIKTAESADEILTLSDVTGMSTDTIQELKYASDFVDVSLETMTGSMTKMIRSMDEARKGTGDAAAAFHDLHLKVTDNNGQLKDSEQMFYDVIDALGKIRNETERDAAAMAIFGKSAQELNPLIDAGSQALQKYAEQAHAMGYVLTPETLNRFEQLDNSMKMFNLQMAAVGGILAQALLPPMTVLFNILNQMDPKVIAIGISVGAIGVIAFTVIKGIVSMAAAWQAYTASTMTASAATATATATSTAFHAVSLRTVVIITAIVAGLAALAVTMAVLLGKAPEVERAVGGIGDSLSQVMQPLKNMKAGNNALGTSNWRGGLTWVGEEGPELMNLPPGTRIYNNRQSMQIAGQQAAEGGSQIININLNVNMSEVDDVSKLVRVVKEAKQKFRAGNVSLA